VATIGAEARGPDANRGYAAGANDLCVKPAGPVFLVETAWLLTGAPA
jgi:hypothetical protein